MDVRVDSKVLYEADITADELQGKRVAVLGYGSQGHAHALNLRDSDADVVVGLRPGSPSRARAESEDLLVLDVSEAVDASEAVMLALPDQDQPQVYEEQIVPVLRLRSHDSLCARLQHPLRPDQSAR